MTQTIPTTTPTLSFSKPEEFLDELRPRGPNVGHDNVVRVSYGKRALSEGPFHRLSVLATYLRNLSYGDEPPVVVVVALNAYQGDLWNDEELGGKTDEAIRKAAEAVRQTIETTARDYGFNVGAGVWQVPS